MHGTASTWIATTLFATHLIVLWRRMLHALRIGWILSARWKLSFDRLFPRHVLVLEWWGVGYWRQHRRSIIIIVRTTLKRSRYQISMELLCIVLGLFLLFDTFLLRLWWQHLAFVTRLNVHYKFAALIWVQWESLRRRHIQNLEINYIQSSLF